MCCHLVEETCTASSPPGLPAARGNTCGVSPGVATPPGTSCLCVALLSRRLSIFVCEMELIIVHRVELF